MVHELYPDAIRNLPQVGVDSLEEQNLPQVEVKTGCGIFNIPWGHNKLIIDKCKGDPSKANFFVKETLKNNWSRAVLMNFLDTDLYNRQGKAISNFDKVLPSVQSDLAQEMTKDPYNFDFLTIRKGYDEKELKDALMLNVQSLLMELGKGFAFVGREYRLSEINTVDDLDDLLKVFNDPDLNEFQYFVDGDNWTISIK